MSFIIGDNVTTDKDTYPFMPIPPRGQGGRSLIAKTDMTRQNIEYVFDPLKDSPNWSNTEFPDRFELMKAIAIRMSRAYHIGFKYIRHDCPYCGADLEEDAPTKETIDG